MSTTIDLLVPTHRHLAPLHASIQNVLPLSPREADACQVFAIGPDLNQEETTKGRFAVVRPVSREELAALPCGQVVLYEYKEELPKEDFPAGSYTVETTLGQLRRYDLQRVVLYASCWLEGEETEATLTDEDLGEVWAVERFIPQLLVWGN